MVAELSEDMWMWVVGGACSIILGLIAFIGMMMLNNINKVKEELKDFRLEFAESKKDTITWPAFGDIRKGMEKDREVDIELALAKHIESYKHEKVS